MEGAVGRFDRARFQPAETGGVQIAGDAMHAGGVGTIGRQIDLDDRVVEPRPFGVGRADGRIRRQVENAGMILGQFKLGARAQHAQRFDAADDALAESDLLAWDVGSRRREHALHAGAGVGRAADHLHGRGAAGVDHADAQPVGVGMGLGLDHIGDDEILQRLGRVVDALDLEADARQRLDDLVERRVGVEVVLEPGEGEFHRASRSLRQIGDPAGIVTRLRLREPA